MITQVNDQTKWQWSHKSMIKQKWQWSHTPLITQNVNGHTNHWSHKSAIIKVSDHARNFLSQSEWSQIESLLQNKSVNHTTSHWYNTSLILRNYSSWSQSNPALVFQKLTVFNTCRTICSSKLPHRYHHSILAYLFPWHDTKKKITTLTGNRSLTEKSLLQSLPNNSCNGGILCWMVSSLLWMHVTNCKTFVFLTQEILFTRSLRFTRNVLDAVPFGNPRDPSSRAILFHALLNDECTFFSPLYLSCCVNN